MSTIRVSKWRHMPHVALVAMMFGAAGCTDSPGPGEPVGIVSGTVKDETTGNPLAGVAVAVSGRTVQTDADGAFTVSGVPVGRRNLTATLAGYHPFADSVTVASGAPAVLQISLRSSTIAPPGPSGLMATAGPVSGSVVLTWNPVPGATSYTIYANTLTSQLQFGTKIPNVSSPYQQNGLTGGVARAYAVTSTGPLGESALSEAVHIVPASTITLTVVEGPSPTEQRPVDSVVVFGVQATSMFALQSIVVRVGPVTTALTYAAANGRWEGALSLVSVPSPAIQQVTLTATDVQGVDASLSYTVLYDKPPVVTLEAPLSGAVARPELQVRASCRDDSPGGCEWLRFGLEGGPLLIEAQASINQSLSLAAYDGQEIMTVLRARDDAGQGVSFRLVVFVDASPHLTAVATSRSGIIVDADAGRLLAVDHLNDYEADTTRLVERTTGVSTTILPPPVGSVSEAWLTPHGSIMGLLVEGIASPRLFEWNDGILIEPGANLRVQLWDVTGDFAVWTEDAGLVRRNLLTEINTIVAPRAGWPSVAANGDVAYVDEGVRLYRSGATSTITTQAADISPLTDGVNVVFLRYPGVGGQVETILHDPTGPAFVTLASRPFLGTFPERGADYQVNSGWTAFTRPDGSGVSQVWVRSPGGVETKLSSFGGNARIRALSATGEVVFDVTRRYRSSAGVPPVDIGATNGLPLYINGQLHVAMGATLFRVD